MLVISRKVGERVEIGDNISLLITRLSGCRVLIGFDAPREIAIRRSELPDRSSLLAPKRTDKNVTKQNRDELEPRRRPPRPR